jgi:transposase
MKHWEYVALQEQSRRALVNSLLAEIVELEEQVKALTKLVNQLKVKDVVTQKKRYQKVGFKVGSENE